VSRSLAEIRVRRGALAERARAERVELERLVESQRSWLDAADGGIATSRYLWRHKHVVAAAALAFAIVRPRRTMRWALQALSLYRLLRALRRRLPA
jgi:hypothetical protein